MRIQCARAVFVAVLLFVGVHLQAQSAGSVSGHLLNSLSGDAIPGATVVLEELRRQTTSAADGTFSIANVPAGSYHLMVKADGYSSRRTEIVVTATASR